MTPSNWVERCPELVMHSSIGVAMVWRRGQSLTHHANQMKLINAIAAAAFINTSTFAIANPVNAGSGCYPNVAVTSFRVYQNGGASSQQAINLAIQENYDGSESCRWRINSAFKNSGLRMPFSSNSRNVDQRTGSEFTYSNCNERVDAIFYRRYPELQGKKLNNMNGPLAREWMDIQESIC